MGPWKEIARFLIPVLKIRIEDPILREPSIFRSITEDLALFAAHREVIGDNDAFFFSYVTQDDLKIWEVTIEEVFDTCYRNFSESNLGGTRLENEEGDLVILDQPGACSASVVSFTECRQWFKDLGTDLLVGLPSRDRVFVTSRWSPMRRDLSDAVRRFYTEDEYPLSDKVYLWTDDGLTPFTEP